MALGSSPAMLQRLEKGGIDAAVLTIPSVFVAEDKGFRAVANFADMGLYSLSGMLSTRRAFLRANRDLAIRFMKGFVEGVAYFNRNKKESIAVLGKKLRTGPESEKYLERAYDLLGQQAVRAGSDAIAGGAQDRYGVYRHGRSESQGRRSELVHRRLDPQRIGRQRLHQKPLRKIAIALCLFRREQTTVEN